MTGPLQGVRVLDMSWVIAGPCSTRILEELGAEIIKVEPPGRGDFLRNGDASGANLGFSHWNTGKQSISIDLKRSEGLDLVKALARKSDVLVENFRKGALERLGLGYEALKEINPGLIYCSITGFGHSSPESYRGVQAAITHAISGIMASVGEPGDPPFQPPTSFADPNAGFQAAIAICAALYEREQTGKGRRIDLSMLDSLIFFMGPIAERRSLGEAAGWNDRAGHLNRKMAPLGTIRGKDGWLMLAVGADDAGWSRAANAIGRPDLAGKDSTWRSENHRQVYSVLEEWVIAQPSVAAAEAILQAHDVPVARVQAPDEMAGMAQLRDRGAIRAGDHPIHGHIDVTHAPYYFDGETPRWQGPAPSIGQHNAEVLSRILGLTDGQIAELKENGVLFSKSK